MKGGFFKKCLVLIVALLFLLTGISAAHAGSIFNETETLEDDNIETVETALDKIRSVTDMGGSPLCSYNQSKTSNMDKITGRELLLNRYDSSEKLFRKLYSRIRQPTMIDGEDGYWDIIVPDDFKSIQDAIDFAEIDDRIFVRSGSYKGNIHINLASLTLHGENKEDTIILGDGIDHVLEVEGRNTNISGFTIRGGNFSYAGVYLRSDYNVLKDNIIKSNSYGVKIFQSCGNTVQNNLLIDNSWSVDINHFSHMNNLTGNTILRNIFDGIDIKGISTYNIVHNNYIENNGGYGLRLDAVSRSNSLTWNVIKANDIGINFSGVSDGSLVFYNAFIDNNLSAVDSSFNCWDNGAAGNYWSDYTGIDIDGDGIGDTPYSIPDGSNQDSCPLMSPPLQSCIYDNLVISTNQMDLKDWRQQNTSCITSFSGQIIDVPEDYLSIQDAVNNSNDGDTIHVHAGTYDEHVVIDKPLTLKGDGSDCTFIDVVYKESGNTIEILDQHQTSDCNRSYGTWGSGKFAQSFIPTLKTLTKLELQIKKKGDPKRLNVLIYNFLSGRYLTGTTVLGSEIPEREYVWVEFDFPDITVIPGNMYYIVFDPSVSSNASNAFYWSFDFNDPYDDGCSWFFDFPEWEAHEPSGYPGFDFCFKTYGNEKCSFTNDHVFEVSADNVDISGFTISNCSVGFSGIRVYGDYCNIHDNAFRYCGSGVELWEANNSFIWNNHLYDNIWGLYVHKSLNIRIVNNTINNNLYGLESGLSNVEILNNIIKNNYLIGFLSIFDCEDLIVGNNITSNDYFGIQVFNQRYSQINNNTIYGGDVGVSFYKSLKNHINNNSIQKNSYHGLELRYFSNNNKIKNNQIERLITSNDVVWDGMYIRNSNNNTISDNNVKCSKALYDTGIYVGIGSNGNIITFNMIDGGDSVEISSCSNCIVKGNCMIGNEEYRDGLRLSLCNNISIINNTISGFKGNLSFFWGNMMDGGITMWSFVSDITICNNAISDNMIGISGTYPEGLVKMIFSLYLVIMPLYMLLEIFLGGEDINTMWNMLNPRRVLREISQCTPNKNMIVKHNVFDQNGDGIWAYYQNSIIEGNTFSNIDRVGLDIKSLSSNVTIVNNNFIFNKIHARFKNSHSNLWDGNYWGRTRFFPKPIFGRIGLIPSIQFDYHPAKKPFFIRG